MASLQSNGWLFFFSAPGRHVPYEGDHEAFTRQQLCHRQPLPFMQHQRPGSADRRVKQEVHLPQVPDYPPLGAGPRRGNCLQYPSSLRRNPDHRSPQDGLDCDAKEVGSFRRRQTETRVAGAKLRPSANALDASWLAVARPGTVGDSSSPLSPTTPYLI